MPLLIKCSSPFAAPRHPHLRAPPHVCCHMCRAHARPCLSTGWALNRRFDETFGTAAVLAQGGGVVGLHPPSNEVPLVRSARWVVRGVLEVGARNSPL